MPTRHEFRPDTESDEARRELLVTNGPAIHVQASGLATSRTVNELQAASGIHKAPAVALIDTGADLNAISNKLAIRVGMPKTGDTLVAGMTGSALAPVYLGRIYIPKLDRVVDGRFFGARLSGKPYQVILGRDFLRDFIFDYNGVNGSFGLMPIDFGSPSDA